MSDEEKPAKETETKTTLKSKDKEEGAAQKEEEEAPPKVVEEDEEGCKKFFWNSRTKEFLGRNGKSWLLITFFYVVFFGFLFAFFMMSWYAALVFIETKEPYKNKEKAILYNNGPGLTYRPFTDPKSNKDSSLILVQTSTVDSYKFWAKQLQKWFDNIPSEGSDCEGNGKADAKKACKVNANPTTYGPVCGNKGGFFGYNQAQPCILLKLNRIFYWTPKPLGTDWKGATISAAGKKAIGGDVAKGVAIWCEGETSVDNQHLGIVEYYPSNIIKTAYFPYQGQKNYQSPFIMMRLLSPTPGAYISIVCKAYAKNIKIHELNLVGFAKFQILVG